MKTNRVISLGCSRKVLHGMILGDNEIVFR